MDWKTLISEIIASGLSQTAIAERLNKSQAWVSSVSQGHYDDLKWTDGQKVRELHAERISMHCSASCEDCPNADDCEERRQRDRRALEKRIQLRRKSN